MAKFKGINLAPDAPWEILIQRKKGNRFLVSDNEKHGVRTWVLPPFDVPMKEPVSVEDTPEIRAYVIGRCLAYADLSFGVGRLFGLVDTNKGKAWAFRDLGPTPDGMGNQFNGEFRLPPALATKWTNCMHRVNAANAELNRDFSDAGELIRRGMLAHCDSVLPVTLGVVSARACSLSAEIDMLKCLTLQVSHAQREYFHFIQTREEET